MALLHSDQPASAPQRRANRSALLLLALGGMALGAWEARQCAADPSAYSAGVRFGSALFLAACICIPGLLLVVYWRTRWAGYGLISAALLSVACFYGGMLVLSRQDRVAWRHEPRSAIPGQHTRASAVICFREGITDQQVEEFDSSVLSTPAMPRHAYLRLLPVNGHEAIAITFVDGTPADRESTALAAIRSDGRVASVFPNASPDSVASHLNPP